MYFSICILFISKLELVALEYGIKEDHIGDIIYSSNSDTNLYSKVLSGLQDEFESVQINEYVTDACVLPNNTLLVSFAAGINLVLFDAEFKPIRGKRRFENCYDLRTFGLTVNNKTNCVYISDTFLNQIIMTDLELNKIKSVGCGFKTGEKDLFKKPMGIFSHENSFLYVCDHENQRIQILNDKLEFKESVYLVFSPCAIKISEKVAILTGISGLKSTTCIYDFKDWVLKEKYEHGEVSLSKLSSYFFEISKESKLYCYNSDGYLIDTINLAKSFTLINEFQTNGIVKFNQNLFLFPNEFNGYKIKL